jgi:hypothetical protein
MENQTSIKTGVSRSGISSAGASYGKQESNRGGRISSTSNALVIGDSQIRSPTRGYDKEGIKVGTTILNQSIGAEPTTTSASYRRAVSVLKN